MSVSLIPFILQVNLGMRFRIVPGIRKMTGTKLSATH